MKKANQKKFEKITTMATKFSGSPGVVLAAFLLILVWALTGPFFDFSEIWQLVINSTTTVITFLMVFIIQHSQNKDTMAIQMKLNELLASQREANNQLINIEDLTEEELEKIKKHFDKLAELSKSQEQIHQSHSLEEAEARHKLKHSGNTGSS